MAVTSRVIEGGKTSITQPYHINGQKGYSYDHWGIDLTGYNGSYNVLAWILAHSDGVVVETRNDCTGFEQNSYGNYVLLKHANGIYTMYAHLSYNTVQVSKGQNVKKGQRLGYMGNTGTSYGGHLHFEVRQSNGYKTDPEPYINYELPNMKKWKKEERWFFYDGDTMLKDWQKNNGAWYYLDPDTGMMMTGWLYDPGYKKWFYLDTSGAMMTGWQKISGKWYYLSPTKTDNIVTGQMMTGWLKNKNKWYYLDPKDGYMYTGTHVIDGKTYHFDNSGALID